MDNKLRTEVRLLKAYQNITYKELAELLEIRVDSFYNWMNGAYNFGKARQNRLQEIINAIKEF